MSKDLLPEEKEPTLGAGFIEAEPTEKQTEALEKWKQESWGRQLFQEL